METSRVCVRGKDLILCLNLGWCLQIWIELKILSYLSKVFANGLSFCFLKWTSFHLPAYMNIPIDKFASIKQVTSFLHFPSLAKGCKTFPIKCKD